MKMVRFGARLVEIYLNDFVVVAVVVVMLLAGCEMGRIGLASGTNGIYRKMKQ